MATFNTLDRVIKESVQVDARCRFTPQKVKFINRENEYYGTFIGKAQIHDSVIEGVELSNCVFFNEDGEKVNMNDLLKLEDRVTKNEFAIDNTKEIVYDLSGNQIPNWISKSVNNASTILSNLILSEIKNERTARISVDNEISSKLTSLSSSINGVTDVLSSQVLSNTEDILVLQNDVSSVKYDLYDRPNLLGGSGLSGKVDFLLSSDRDSMGYFGNAPYLDLSNATLADFLAFFDRPQPKYDRFFKKGFMFRLSADQILVDKNGSGEVKLFENDYFIFNKDTVASCATSADINIIRDAQNETSAAYINLQEQIWSNDRDIAYLSGRINSLCSEISTSLNKLSDDLSNEIILSVGAINDRIQNVENNVDYISSKVDSLCSEISTSIDNLSERLDDEISGLSSTVDKKVAGLNYNDISTEHGFVSKVTQDGGVISVQRRDLVSADIPVIDVSKISDFESQVSSELKQFNYDIDTHKITLNIAGNISSIDTTDFVKNRVVTHVNVWTRGTVKDLIIWFTMAGQATDWIPVEGTTVEGTDYVSININDLTKVYNFTNGISSDGQLNVGATEELVRWNEISTYSRNLKFNGHIKDNDILKIQESDTVSAFFDRWCETGNLIYNGSFLDVEFSDNTSKISTQSGDFVIGKGDVIIIHEHTTDNVIDASKLVCPGNVYIIKAGVSRYEFEDLSSQVISNDNDISAISSSLNLSVSNLINTISSVSSYLSTEIDNLSTSLSNEVKLSVNTLVDQISSNDSAICAIIATVVGTIDELSVGLSNEVKLSVSSIIDTISSVSNDLSTKIDNVVKVGIGSDSSCLSNTNLSVWKLPKDEYDRLLVDGNINDDCLYVVSSDYVDAYGRMISNVSMTPEYYSEESYIGIAATKPYVDMLSVSITESQKGILSGLYTKPEYKCFNDMKVNGVNSDISTVISSLYKALEFLGAFN